MIILPLLLSLITGFVIVTFLFRKTHVRCVGLRLNLSLGLGLGISGLISFYCLWIFNQSSGLLLLTAHILFVVILCLCNRKNLKESFTLTGKNDVFRSFFHPIAFVKYVLWVVLIALLIFFAKAHAFGEWDAWALYNMKMRFFASSGHFKEVFQQLHWHTQPDYPVLLPMINTWIYKISKAPLAQVPMITGIVFTFICAILIYQGLSQFMNKFIAFLPSLLLLCNPFYTFLGTAQYADVLLSYYLACVLITLMIALTQNNPSLALLAGLFLGLLSFVKNEGIVMSIILIGLTAAHLFFNKKSSPKENLRLFLFLILGFMITGSTTVLFKLCLAPANKDVSANISIMNMKYFNLDGLKLVAQALAKEFTHERWGHLWMLVIGLSVLAVPKLISEENRIIFGFFLIYGLILLFIYLTTVNFELAWRLKQTLGRICFYLMPSVFFFLFYMHFKKKIL